MFSKLFSVTPLMVILRHVLILKRKQVHEFKNLDEANIMF